MSEARKVQLMCLAAVVFLLAGSLAGRHAMSIENAKSIEAKASAEGYTVAGIQSTAPGTACDVFVFNRDGSRNYLARIECPPVTR